MGTYIVIRVRLRDLVCWLSYSAELNSPLSRVICPTKFKNWRTLKSFWGIIYHICGFSLPPILDQDVNALCAPQLQMTQDWWQTEPTYVIDDPPKGFERPPIFEFCWTNDASPWTIFFGACN